jgi:hypothetical protein
MVTGLGRADSASDSNRSARSARTAGDDRHTVEARAWSGDTVTVLAKDPEGGNQGDAEQAC